MADQTDQTQKALEADARRLTDSAQINEAVRLAVSAQLIELRAEVQREETALRVAKEQQDQDAATAEDTRVRDGAKKFEKSRLAERGKALDRGRELDRGRASDGSGANQVVQDVFRRVSNLGGHLVVAFVAPLSASNQSQGIASRVEPSSAEVEAASARALLQRLIDQVKAPTK